MKRALGTLMGLALLQAAAYAQQGPTIEMVDGKISMSAQSVPLGRLFTLFDQATGLESEVKPELANTSITVQFTGLEVQEAVRKIFQGQPLNYMLIHGKGVRVTERADGSVAASAAGPAVSSSPFPSSQPLNSFNDVQRQPQNVALPLPGSQSPPANGNNQPATINTLFGPVANPNANAAPASNATAPMTAPGQMPSNQVGAGNPLNNPVNTVIAPVQNAPAPAGGASAPGGATTPGALPR